MNLDSITAALTELFEQPGQRFVMAVNEPADHSPESVIAQDDRSDSSTPSPCGASFWIGLPWISLECSRRWIGERLFFFPGPLPAVRRIAVVSSRMRQRLDLESWWFDLLRTAVLQCDPVHEALVVENATAGCGAVARAAALFGRPVIRFDVSLRDAITANIELRKWLATCFDGLTAGKAGGTSGQVLEVCVSPEIRPTGSHSYDMSLNHIPPGDRLLFAAANRIQVLACRNQGNVEELVKTHVHDAERQRTPLWIASDAAGELPSVVADLPLGCIPWLVAPCPPDAIQDESPLSVISGDKHSANSNALRAKVVSSPLSNSDDWLLHWTRASRGPWPGESEEDFLDALILRSESVDRSALATLLKIVADGKLLASSEGIRGGHSVVAFTSVPLTEFRSRRVFRKHRNRFDFEPWGVAIQKEQLTRIGVRPVIYGNDDDWRTLEPVDRPFFQKATMSGATMNVEEREHRSVGSVDLRQFPKQSVCIFAGDPGAAQMVSRHCDWPVIVVPG